MRTASILLAAAASLLPFVGCTAVPTVSAPDLAWLTKLSGNDEGPPAQLVAMWTDASMKKPGATASTRGFGGRIYFYDAKQHSVKAEGDLVIYAFVEKDRQVPSKLPDRKFVFTSEELEENYQKTALGHCYDIWLPWGQDRDETVSVSLVPTLKMANDKVVLGSQSLNVLKGKEAEGLDKMTVNEGSGVRQVSYDSDGEPAKGESSRRRMSIYDPQTNVTVGPAQIPAARLPGPAPGAMQTSFESELPQATGVSTTTIDLPKSMALSMKKAPPSGPRTLSDRFAAYRQAENSGQIATSEPQSGVKFDLAVAAALDRRANSPQASKAGQASPDSLARFIAANAGAVPSVSGSGAKHAAEERSEKKPPSRFSPSPRKTPAWTRSQARWRQED